MTVVETVSVDSGWLAARWQMALLTGTRQGGALRIELDRINLINDAIDLEWQLQIITWSHGCERIKDKYGVCGAKLRTACPHRFLDRDPDRKNWHLAGVAPLGLSKPWLAQQSHIKNKSLFVNTWQRSLRKRLKPWSEV